MSPRELLKLTITKIDGAYAPATIRAYKANFERFIDFCENHQALSLPAGSDIVTTYIRELADGRLTSASVRIAIASISAIHRLNQFSDPTTHPDVKLEMRRMHRKLGRQSKQAQAINMATLRAMLANTENSLISLRDRALLLTAYDGMCRRSELISLNIEDISYTENDSIKIKLRRSKTDQDGLGRWLHLSKESQNAIIDWMNAAKINSGKIFRGINQVGEVTEKLGPSQVNRIFKKLARKTKLNDKIVERISGHSMRVGAAQDMLTSGENLAKIMQRGRWSKTDTVMRYIENATFA